VPEPPSAVELSLRLQTAEATLERLRKFRDHDFKSFEMGVLMKLEALDLKVARALIVAPEISAVREELRVFRAAYDLKVMEYDKERSLASRIAWPVVIALAVAAALAIAGLLIRAEYLLK